MCENLKYRTSIEKSLHYPLSVPGPTTRYVGPWNVTTIWQINKIDHIHPKLLIWKLLGLQR
jgi:hypothetical protein